MHLPRLVLVVSKGQVYLQHCWVVRCDPFVDEGGGGVPQMGLVVMHCGDDSRRSQYCS